jgi:DNA polymerase elongation subunit (family B)
MLIDFEYHSGSLICSYINEKGNVKLKQYPWPRPTKLITTHEDDPERSGKYVTWDGHNVKEVYTRYPNKYSCYDFIDQLPQAEQDILMTYHEPNIFFIDIETEILDKKPEPQLAESKVLSIAIVNKDKALVMGVDPLKKDQITSIEADLNNKYGKPFNKSWQFQYNCYKNEFELLYNFFHSFVPKMAVMTGWNFIHFDWVFLVNRFRKIGGDPAVASFTKNLRSSWRTNDYSEKPAHRLVVDYMELYEKWDQSVKVKESSALDFVAGQILGDDFGKVSYTGDLKNLYKNSKRDFIYYNVVDTVLVQLIHEKTKYVDIMYAIGNKGNITIQNALSTLAVTEGILRKKFRDQKNIILCRFEQDEDSSSVEGSVSGGFVLPPVKGMGAWTCCYDFASLYPMTVRQFNISADSYKGQVPNIKIEGEIQPNVDSKYCIFGGHQIPIEKDDIILLNGSVFKNEEGVVAQVMREVYSDRKKFKKMMMKEHYRLEELKREKKKYEEMLIGT